MLDHLSKKTETVTLRMPINLKIALERIAEGWGKSLSLIIIESLDHHIETFYCKKCRGKLFGSEIITDDEYAEIINCRDYLDEMLEEMGIIAK